MPFSTLKTAQYQDLVNDYFDKLIFNEIREFDQFYAATQNLIEPTKPESKFEEEHLKSLKNLLENGFDENAAEPSAFTPKSRAKTTPEGKELEVKVNKLAIIQEARDEFKKIMVDTIRARLNEMKDLKEGEKQNYIKMQRLRNPFIAALASLEAFTSDSNVGTLAKEFKAEIEKLQAGKSTEKEPLTENNLLTLNTKLEKFLKESKISSVQENESFRKTIETLFQTLPRNVCDFATLEPVTPDSRIVTSDRYQFDINSIVNWINTKNEYQNPATNQPFNQNDQQRIQRIAKKHGLTINVSGIFHAEENPAMMAGVLAAIAREAQDEESQVQFPVLNALANSLASMQGRHATLADSLLVGPSPRGFSILSANPQSNQNANTGPQSGHRGTGTNPASLLRRNESKQSSSSFYPLQGTAYRSALGSDYYFTASGNANRYSTQNQSNQIVNTSAQNRQRESKFDSASLLAAYQEYYSRGTEPSFFRRIAPLSATDMARELAELSPAALERKALESPAEAIKILLEENSRHFLLQGNPQQISDRLKRIALTGSAPARQMLENKSLCEQLLGGNLATNSTTLKELANANIRTAQCILESQPLRAILLSGSAQDNATFLHNLAKKDSVYANYLFTNRDCLQDINVIETKDPLGRRVRGTPLQMANAEGDYKAFQGNNVLREIILTPDDDAVKAERFSYWMERNPKQVVTLNLFDEPFRSVVFHGSAQDQAKRLELIACSASDHSPRILEEKSLRDKLLYSNPELKEPQKSKEIADRLKNIAMKNRNLANVILKDLSLRNILLQGNDTEQFTSIRDLACASQFAFLFILETPDLREILLQGDPAQQAETLKMIVRSEDGPGAAMLIFDDKELRDILLNDVDKAENLVLLAHINGVNILEEKSMRDILLAGDEKANIKRLVSIASTNVSEENARLILEEKSPYRAMLLSNSHSRVDKIESLKTIAKSLLSSARIILEDKQLNSELFSGSAQEQAEIVAEIACTVPITKAAYILESKPMREKLLQGDAKTCTDRLVRISSFSPDAAKKILSGEVLRSAMLTGTPAEQLVRLETIATALFNKYSDHTVMTTINNLSKEISASSFGPSPGPTADRGRNIIL